MMQKTTKTDLSRRAFLGTTGTLLTSLSVAPALISAPNILKFYNKPNSLIRGVQIGTITYSFRSMPDQSAEATLKYIVDAGISAIELMGDPVESFAGAPKITMDRRKLFQLSRMQRNGEAMTDDQKKELADLTAQMEDFRKQMATWRATVSMDKFAQLRKMYKAAGVKIYGFKPSAFEKNNTDAEIEYGLRAAKTLGASHVTLEHPSDDAHTMRLGKLALKHKVYVAYHGHEQQTPTFWDTALTQSKYNALNLDLGHFVAAGNADPLGILKAKHQHIKSMHMKDRQTPANGKKNLPWGTGDTPLVDALRAHLARRTPVEINATSATP
ncbi:MAG: sugar phosphate isomerase/epimerase family protein [Saprospiraceae bacterium]